MRRLLSLALVVAFTAPSLADGKKEFEEHKKKATIHYELAEYDKAIEEYKAAYAISQEVWILYNIAQAYRLAGNCALAGRFYKNYVTAVAKGKDPAPERTKHAQEQLPLMEKCAAEKPPPGQAAATKPATPPPAVEPAKPPEPSPPPTAEPAAIPPATTPEPVPADEESDPGRWKRIAGLSLLGGGVVLVGAGVLFNLQALDKEQELEERFSSGVPREWTADDQALSDEMDSLKTRAVVFYVVGGVVLAGGGVLTYLGFTEEHAEAVAIVPLRGGAAVATSFRF